MKTLIVSRKTSGRQSGRRPCVSARVALAALGIISLMLLAFGCGGSSGEGVAQVGTSTSSSSADSSGDRTSGDPVAYSTCMRAHGVPDFPDPDADGNFPNLDLEHTPAIDAARDACRDLRPRRELSPEEQEEAQELRLAYSRCMREHGVTNFPDEKPSADSGVNPDSPAYEAADRACNHFLMDVPDD
jgi:hypothetical protein